MLEANACFGFQGPLTDADVQNLVEVHILPRAKTIRVQQLAPDISQTHVIKLLKEHIWQFKQIFSHFGIQSLTEVRIAAGNYFLTRSLSVFCEFCCR